jgi:hypothetical protein
MPLCRICSKSVFEGIHLSDGGMIHESCLEFIQAKELEIQSEIYEQLRIKNSLTHEIERRKGLIFKFVSIFSKPDSDLTEIEEKATVVQQNINQLSSSLSSLKASAACIYDYFLTYPPDWDERRTQVAERDGKECKNCGNRDHLHLHHIAPLSKGGNNRIENLKLLCEKCHSKKHGGKHFSYELFNTETAFSKRVANIRYAIENSKWIKFGYKKPKDKGHKQRIVKPAELINVAHVWDSGSTLCVRGYCELRNAERIFALKRMRGVKVVTETPEIKSTPKKKKVPSKKLTKKTKPRKKSTPAKKKQTNPSSKMKAAIKKTPVEDMYEQLEKHDLENLELMGHDTDTND